MTAKMTALATEPNLESMAQPVLRTVRRDRAVVVANVGQLPAFQWTIDPRDDMETFDSGVSFEMMQSWEHNETGRYPDLTSGTSASSPILDPSQITRRRWSSDGATRWVRPSARSSTSRTATTSNVAVTSASHNAGSVLASGSSAQVWVPERLFVAVAPDAPSPVRAVSA